MRHILPLVSFSILAATAARAGAQICLGLPAATHTSVAMAFEGTDGLSGSSASVMHGRRLWGVQARAERYDDQGPRRDAWYGGDVQVARVVEPGAAPATAPDHGRQLCATFATRYQHDVQVGRRFQRLRMPLGLALGYAVVLSRDGYGSPEAFVATFAQPQLLLHHERWRSEGTTGLATRTNVSVAGAIGVSAGVDGFLFRTVVQYAAGPGYMLNRKHNWLELTLQIGRSF